MVKVGEYEVHEGLYYHKEHFWVKIEGNNVRFGATDYGQKALREIVFVELPRVGDDVRQNEAYGTVESVKAVVDLIAPVSGAIKEVNEKIKDSPDLINNDPYGNGWFILVSATKLNDELKNLMTFEAAVAWYKELAKGG
jgi:glycine cleavage system H protein